MAKANESYRTIVVESYMPASTAGLHGKVHVRPVAGQGLSQSLQVECAKSLSTDYPVGTRFQIKVKLTDRKGSGDFLYSFHGWPVQVV